GGRGSRTGRAPWHAMLRTSWRSPIVAVRWWVSGRDESRSYEVRTGKQPSLKTSMQSCVSDPPTALAPPRAGLPAWARDSRAVYPRRAMERSLEDRGIPPARASDTWVEDLRSDGVTRDQAIADLHALLLGAARFELSRRRAALSHVRGEDLEDVATQAADDALMAVLMKLDDY